MRNQFILTSIFSLFILMATSCQQKGKDKVVKYGYEYLKDSIYENKFNYLKKDSLDQDLIAEEVKKGGVKYYNHLLYCLDTISTYKSFLSSSYFVLSDFMELSVFWGSNYSDLELSEKMLVDTVSKERFLILKHNTIKGASVIVNSGLFNKCFVDSEDESYIDKKRYLYEKYWPLYKDKRYMSDSILEVMHNDAERLCEKWKDCK